MGSKSAKGAFALSGALALGILLALGLIWWTHRQQIRDIEAAHALRMDALASQAELWNAALAGDPCKARAALDGGRP